LHDAAAEGHSKIVDLLLKSGANIDACSNQNVTPLMCAAAWDYFDTVKLLLDQGADASIQDCTGATALDTALEKGEDDRIVELLKSGRKRGHSRMPLS
jgi:ankyrin repeat protein